jgi:biopolymer transport protein TolR
MTRRHRKRKPMSEINVVPYIDVMLVLLVIFMITAPLLTQGVKVDLPSADAKPIEDDAKRPLVVGVDRDGQFSLTYDDDKVNYLDTDELLLKATAIIKFNPGVAVLVKGDRAVDYGQVVAAMVLLQAAGADSVGLLTQPPES